MNESTVLLISPNMGVCEMTQRAVDAVGCLGLTVVSGLDEAYACEGWNRVALVVIHLDHWRSGHGVVRLLRMIAAARRPVATVVLAERLDETRATGFLRMGAADVLLDPFNEGRFSYLIEVLTLRARTAGVTAVTPAYATEMRPVDDFDPMTIQARQVAAQDTTILLNGESGTGKSRLARLIHDMSPRRAGRLVTIRCASIAPELFEEELLGNSNSPDGQRYARGGRVGEARGGTLLFEDVDTLAPVSQAALFRWIEEGAIEAYETGGRPRSRPRIIATARRSLGESVATGEFRPDLFYRLNVIGLELMPLRDRRDEMPDLIERLLDELGRSGVSLSAESLHAFATYNWPGNVRELRDCLESSLASVRGTVIGRELLPDPIRVAARWSKPILQPMTAKADVPSLTTTLAQTKCDAEYARITEALDKHAHNRLRTAHELGISRMTLYKKLYKYGIIEQEGREGWFPGGRIPRSTAT